MARGVQGTGVTGSQGGEGGKQCANKRACRRHACQQLIRSLSNEGIIRKRVHRPKSQPPPQSQSQPAIVQFSSSFGRCRRLSLTFYLPPPSIPDNHLAITAMREVISLNGMPPNACPSALGSPCHSPTLVSARCDIKLTNLHPVVGQAGCQIANSCWEVKHVAMFVQPFPND